MINLYIKPLYPTTIFKLFFTQQKRSFSSFIKQSNTRQLQYFSKSSMISLPRLYANINKNLPQEYWDYDNYENSWGFLSFNLPFHSKII